MCTADDEVIQMVSEAHRTRPTPAGIIMRKEQAEKLLKAGRENDKLRAENNGLHEEIESMKEARQQEKADQERSNTTRRYCLAGFGVLPVAVYIGGAIAGLMDPTFATIMGVPWVLFSAVCCLPRRPDLQAEDASEIEPVE